MFALCDVCSIKYRSKEELIKNMWGLYIDEFLPLSTCAVRTTVVKRNFDNMWEMYMEESVPL